MISLPLILNHYLFCSPSHISGGAKINRIFYDKFMFELARLNTDEKALHAKIGKAILNAQGIRTGLFTPKMAFDGIVNDQITEIKAPILKVCF